MANPVLQFQILSKEPETTAKFYAELFGWKIGSSDAIGYRSVETDSNEGISGGIWPAPQQAGSFTQWFVGVADIGAAVETATKLGGKVLMPATVLPDGGKMAVMQDPLGMSFGLWQRK